jgi:hypothetical protein
LSFHTYWFDDIDEFHVSSCFLESIHQVISVSIIFLELDFFIWVLYITENECSLVYNWQLGHYLDFKPNGSN